MLANLAFTESGSDLHELAGYTAVGIVAFRLLWGLIGSRHARFSDFWPTPARLKAHWQQLKHGQTSPHPGHNPFGALMMLAVLVVGFLSWTGRPMALPSVLRVLPWLLPLPFIANSVGWFIAEVGRQPWIVVGLQRTSDAVSPNLTGTDVWLTMIGFTVIYLLLAIAALYIAVRFIRHTSVQSEEGSDI